MVCLCFCWLATFCRFPSSCLCSFGATVGGEAEGDTAHHHVENQSSQHYMRIYVYGCYTVYVCMQIHAHTTTQIHKHTYRYTQAQRTATHRHTHTHSPPCTTCTVSI
eukprot:GHVQ01029862.1.p1 GENE.GHVQ01029862.1~~GHVQ01029862.1.p1  ORF type:complete len:107 (-),score=15.59 GHVQ01029862.1:564-884(-)